MPGSRLKFVIFEGPDKVGKTTLFKLFRRATDYIPLAIDRFTASNYVYDKFYKRETNLKEYLKAEEKIQEIFDCYLILLTCRPEIVDQRIRAEEKGIDKVIALGNYRGILKGFEEYYKISKYTNKCVIDTSDAPEQDCLREILKFTNEKRVRTPWDPSY